MLDASNRTFTASITRSHFFYEFPIATPPGRPNLSQSSTFPVFGLTKCTCVHAVQVTGS